MHDAAPAANGGFFGRCLAQRSTGAATLASWSGSSHKSTGRHIHETAHFFLVTGGHYRIDATDCGGDAGTLTFNPAGTEHGDHFEGGGSFFTLTLPAIRELDGCEASIRKGPVVLDSTNSIMLAFRLLGELNAWEPDSEFVAHELVLELVASLGRPARKPGGEGWLGLVRDLIEEGLEGPLGLDRLAAEAGVHPVHVTRAFRQRYGVTPGEYQRIRRLERAAHLLVDCRAPVAEVAFSCGFADQAHLTRRFVETYGVTPTAYRRLIHG